MRALCRNASPVRTPTPLAEKEPAAALAPRHILRTELKATAPPYGPSPAVAVELPAAARTSPKPAMLARLTFAASLTLPRIGPRLDTGTPARPRLRHVTCVALPAQLAPVPPCVP